MIYISLVLALAVGYVIGLLQNGINIHQTPRIKNKEKLKSQGIPEFMDYYKDSGGKNPF